jgi:cyclophilin family peptidyl-prolyl cis-trans isomerase
MRPVRFTFLAGLLVTTCALFAQSSVPTLLQPIPAQTLAPGSSGVTLDLRNYFSVPGVTGQIAQITTTSGVINVELLANDAPQTVANFLNYVSSGRYQNAVFHRVVSNFILQAGGYTATVPATAIPTFAPVVNEFRVANVRGTLAMAKLGGNPNSATSQWFFNLADNRANLDNQNGGFTVFARVIGTGMTVVDAIVALQRADIGLTPGEGAATPVRNVPPGETQMRPEYYVAISNVRTVPLFPSGSGPSVLTVTEQSSAPTVVSASLSGPSITLQPVGPGTANITVRVADTHGNAASSTIAVTVAAGVPVFSMQPVSQDVAAGSTVVFNAPATGAASYRWERNGVQVAGASTGTLVINNATTANAGTYVAIATNSVDSVRSSPATLTVTTLPATQVGRLVNLSILTVAGAGSRVLTMGAFVGGGDAGAALPLVIRAVGPTLAQPPFNVSGVLPDPTMNFYAAGNTTPIETNDNWGGGSALADAFRLVAAFDLPAASLDSAIVRTTPGVASGGYTVQVTGKGEASGSVIAEMYDAAGANRTATTPRLTNLSTRAQIDTGGNLTVGFVLGGQSARTVLVRGIGPSLSQFGLTGLMDDPRLELYNNNNGQQIAANDDWAGSAEISTAAASVGAFGLIGGTSKDAVLLVTLPPGPYSARINGANGAGGAAIVEVYEVP